jgi:hypothetical protein
MERTSEPVGLADMVSIQFNCAEASYTTEVTEGTEFDYHRDTEAERRNEFENAVKR